MYRKLQDVIHSVEAGFDKAYLCFKEEPVSTKTAAFDLKQDLISRREPLTEMLDDKSLHREDYLVFAETSQTAYLNQAADASNVRALPFDKTTWSLSPKITPPFTEFNYERTEAEYQSDWKPRPPLSPKSKLEIRRQFHHRN